MGPVECQPLDQIKSMFNTDVFGLIDMCQRVLPSMRERRSGRIINISSVAGVWGQPGCETYCAAKHAVDGFSQGLGRYSTSFGVHVSTINPGSIATSFGSAAVLPQVSDPYK